MTFCFKSVISFFRLSKCFLCSCSSKSYCTSFSLCFWCSWFFRSSNWAWILAFFWAFSASYCWAKACSFFWFKEMENWWLLASFWTIECLRLFFWFSLLIDWERAYCWRGNTNLSFSSPSTMWCHFECCFFVCDLWSFLWWFLCSDY